jgi:hypothetical protein
MGRSFKLSSSLAPPRPVVVEGPADAAAVPAGVLAEGRLGSAVPTLSGGCGLRVNEGASASSWTSLPPAVLPPAAARAPGGENGEDAQIEGETAAGGVSTVPIALEGRVCGGGGCLENDLLIPLSTYI